MNPTLEQTRQKYFFQLVQTVRFNYNDAEFLKNAEQQLLSEYEDLIPPSELQRIKGLTDPVEKILSLIDAARKTSLSEDPSSLGNLAENLRIYQENQKEVAKAQAESEIAKKTVHTPYKWFGEYVQTVTSTLGEIPNTTEIDPEIVAAALINDPHAAESITQVFGFSDPTTTPIDTAISMADVIPPIAESNFHPEISYIYEEAKNQTGSLPDTVAGANTFLKSGLPSATQTNFQDLNQKIQVLLEAKTGSPVTIPDSLSTTISGLNLNVSPEQLLTQTLTTRLSRENIPQPAVQQLVKFMPAVYAIYSYTPTKSIDNKKEISENRSQVFSTLTQAVLSQFGIIRPESLQNLSYAWIYSATRSYYESQAYNYQPQLQNNGQNHEYDPRLSFVYQSAKNYVTDYGQDFVVNAALDAAVAGPLGAWILPAGPINIMMDVATAAEVAAAAPAAGAVTTAAVGGAAVATGAEVGAATGAAAGGPIAPLTALIGAIIGFLIVKGKDIFSWLKRQSKNLILLLGGGIALLGGALGMALAGIVGLGIPGMVIGAGVGAVGFTALTGGSKALSAAASKATAFTGALVGLAAVEIGTTVIIIAISIPIVVALILFIINTSAFVVPPNPIAFGDFGLPPGTSFNCTDSGALVSAPNSTLKLLPDTNRIRAQQLCIVPTEIVMHWSAGVVINGAIATYNTLVSRDLACHYATDPDTTLQMLQIWEKKVEFSACQGSPHNDYAIGIEMSGTCFSSMPGSCYGVDNPPPEAEIQRTVDLVCWLKKQYNIKTIIGHYEIPYSGKSDPGKDFLYQTFLPRVNTQCP